MEYADSHVMVNADNTRTWVDGWVRLARRRNEVLWTKRLQRLVCCQVANNGNVVIIERLREKKEPGGKVYIINQKGETLFEKRFDSDPSSCAVSKDGTFAVISTLF